MSKVITHLNTKKVTFDISLTKKCNFRCSYCYAKDDLKNETMSRDNLAKMVKIIKEIQERYYDLNEWKIQLNIYGGEPLLTLDEIKYMAKEMEDYTFVIVTNGSLIEENMDKILKIRNKLGTDLKFNVSYDYTLQNITRKKNTYDLVRNNIKLLDEYGIYVHTISTFTAENILSFYDNIIDWNNLRNELNNANFNFRYNIDDNLVSTDYPINERELRTVLENTNRYIQENGINRRLIRYNSGYGTKQDIKTSKEMSSDIVKHICAFNENGDIYTGIRVLFLPDEVRIADKYGNVNDSVDTILENKDRILKQIKEASATNSEQCANCPNFCKPLFARTLTVSNGNIVEANRKYSDTWCKIHDLLHEYELQ